MRSRTSLAIIVVAVSFFAGCSRKAVESSSPAGALSSNSAAPVAKLFERRSFNTAGFRHLDDLILPEVRQRLDTEPVGESDIYIAPTAEQPGGESEPQETFNEDNPASQLEIEKAKYNWATKKYGDALAADPNSTGVIVFYADEAYYDIGRFEHFVAEGRDRVATNSGVEPSRIQVVFGGYRGMAQAELWIVPAGTSLPEVRPESREPPSGKEY